MSTEISDAFNATYADGPSTAPTNPPKSAIRAIGRTIQTSVDTAKSSAAAAQATANTGVANAATAQTTANNALSIAGTGIKWTANAVRVRSTANVAIASGLENGDTLNGVTLATGDVVALLYQSAPAENGLYTVVASGAASRATWADSAAELGNIGFVIAEGTAGAGEQWTLPLASGSITVGTTALNFGKVGTAVGVSAEVVAGRGVYASLGAAHTGIEKPVTDVLDSVLASQIIGSPRTLVNGTALGNNTYAFQDPVERTGYINTIEGYGINGGGTLKVRRLSKSGDTFTVLATYNVTIPAGSFRLTRNDFGSIPVNAGELLGFYPGSTAIIPKNSLLADSFPGIYSGTGDVTTSFTDSTVDTTSKIELRFTVGGVVDNESRITEAERALRSTADGLATALVKAGAFDPGVTFGVYDGAWLDFSVADDLESDLAGSTPAALGDPIGYAEDKSFHDRGFAATATGKRPVLAANQSNGLAAAIFDGTDDTLVATALDMTRNRDKLSIFSVVRFDTVDAHTVVTHQSEGTGSAARAFLGTFNGYRAAAAGRSTDAGSLVTAYGPGVGHSSYPRFALVEGVYDWANGKVKVYVNGFQSQEGIVDLPATGNSPDAPERYAFIGGNDQSGAQYHKGAIGEIGWILGDLTTKQRKALYSYFAEKWGLTMDPLLRDYNPGFAMPGAWTWYNGSRVHAVSSTRFAVGAVSPAGSVWIADYDFGAGSIAHHRISDLLFQTDDHDNPAIIVDSDGYLRAFYCRHNDQHYYVAKSTNVGDPSAWGTPVDIGDQIAIGGDASTEFFAYAVPIQLSGESNKLYLFARNKHGDDGEWTLHFTTSVDDGDTWATLKQILSDGRPYFQIAKNGTDRIDFLVNDGHAGLFNNRTYHFYYQGGSFYKTDGTLIGAIADLPFNQGSDLSLIYDPSTAGRWSSWVWDIVISGSGQPIGCFSTYNNGFTDHRYHQARWNGSAWVVHEICQAGGTICAPDIDETLNYSGGVITDPEDINTVYCSRQVDADGNLSSTGTHHIFRYVTADSGATWTGTQLTFGDEPHIRPFIPIGARRLFFLRGVYTHYTEFRTVIDSISIA